MGLHTDYLGSLRIEPPLSPAEVDFLKSFSRTRRCGDRAALDVVQHPADNDQAGDVESYNRPATGMPGLWCPWTCCDEGGCLSWDGGEKAYAPDRWLRYLINTFLRPGAALAADPAARDVGLTFDHVLAGMIVGERQETGELFALAVKDNVVRRRTLVPAREGVDEWGYRGEDEEREERTTYLAARRDRFAAAIAEDLRRAG
jgi:hypothetical protein